MMELDFFDECVEALQDDILILSNWQTRKLDKIFGETVLAGKHSYIYWDEVEHNHKIYKFRRVWPVLRKLLKKPIDRNIYIIWDNWHVVSIRTDLILALINFDDIECLSYKVWFYNPEQGWAMETAHKGYLRVGLFEPQEIDFMEKLDPF